MDINALTIHGTATTWQRLITQLVAQWALKFSRFAPVGLRGMDGVEAAAKYSLAPMQEYMAWTLRETFVLFQVEDKESLDIIEDVAWLEGLDGLFFGPGDMLSLILDSFVDS